MLTVDPSFLAWIPKFVLGGLLLYLGASLMYEWLVDAARRISLLEYASLLAIALLIVQVGFIAGVLIGVIIGCATFAVSASRVDAVKFSFDGSEYRSTLDRGPDELAILAAHGREIQGMSLQSYLFFGSANRLYERVKALFAERARLPLPGVRLPPRHRPRLLGHAQLHPDQAGGRGGGRPSRAGELAERARATPSARAGLHHRRRDPRPSDLDRALEILRAGGHCGAFGRRRRRRHRCATG